MKIPAPLPFPLKYESIQNKGRKSGLGLSLLVYEEQATTNAGPSTPPLAMKLREAPLRMTVFCQGRMWIDSKLPRDKTATSRSTALRVSMTVLEGAPGIAQENGPGDVPSPSGLPDLIIVAVSMVWTATGVRTVRRR